MASIRASNRRPGSPEAVEVMGMIYISRRSGQTLWAPSLLSGEVFAAFATQAGRLFDVDIGLRFDASDLVSVECRQARALGLVMATRSETHEVLYAQVHGVAEICLVLADRDGLELAGLSRTWVEAIASRSTRMPNA